MKLVRMIKEKEPGEERPQGNGTASKVMGLSHRKKRSRREAELPRKSARREVARPGEGTEDERKGTSTREGPDTSGEHRKILARDLKGSETARSGGRQMHIGQGPPREGAENGRNNPNQRPK